MATEASKLSFGGCIKFNNRTCEEPRIDTIPPPSLTFVDMTSITPPLHIHDGGNSCKTSPVPSEYRCRKIGTERRFSAPSLSPSLHHSKRIRRRSTNYVSYRSIFITAFYYGITFTSLYLPYADGQIVGVIGPVVDEEACFSNLEEADKNGDEFLNRDEYVNFINLQSDGYFDNHIDRTNGEFEELPDVLTELYYDLACGSTDTDEDRAQTCTRRIRIEGSYNPSDNDDEDQSKLLYKVCSQTYSTVQSLVSVEPSSFPTFSFSLSPSTAPTLSPIGFEGELPFRYEVTMGYIGGFNANAILLDVGENSIRDDLVTSITTITAAISVEVNTELQYRRRLEVSPSEVEPIIVEIKDRVCPTTPLPVENQRCVDVTFETYIYAIDVDRESVETEFNESFLLNIQDNFFSDNAEDLNDNILYIIPKAAIPPQLRERVALGPSELAGIGAAGFILGFALIGAMFVHGRKRRNRLKDNVVLDSDENESLPESDDYYLSSSPRSVGQAGELNSSNNSELMRQASSKKKKKKSQIIGATHPHYGRSQNSARSNILNITDDGASSSEQSSYNESYASSSNAGSSGWSSGGVSSLNTASVESIENDRRMQGSSLVSIGLASGMASRLPNGNDQQGNLHFIPFSRRSTNGTDVDTISTNSDQLMSGALVQEGGVPNLPVISRADLDEAIQAGDWAAVGATAALLANAASDTVSLSTKSYSDHKSSGSSSISVSVHSQMSSSVDAARAAELDHLVDSGNWDGVVLAAAKFEAASDRGSTDGSSDNSQSFRSMGDSFNNSSSFYTDRSSKASQSGSIVSSTGQSHSSIYSTATGSVNSESLSRVQKRDEIKSEVEALVRRVVPDEIDNVDEMMLQFRGREEELLETLRTMQERSIAQRARAAVHKSAKREAKMEARSRQLRPGQPSLRSNFSASKSGTSTDYFTSNGVSTPGTSDYFTPKSSVKSKSFNSTSGDDSSTQSGSHSQTTGSSRGGLVGIFSNRPGSVSSKKRRKGNEYNSSNSITEASSSSGRKGSSRTSSTITSDAKKKSALDLAIEAGDWEAVGEAAAAMSDNDGSSLSSGGVVRLASATVTSDSSAGSTSKNSSGRYSMGSANADKLDEMIDKGDWQGVVTAASMFTTGDSGPIHSSGRFNSAPTKSMKDVPHGNVKSSNTTPLKTPLKNIGNKDDNSTSAFKSFGSKLFKKSLSQKSKGDNNDKPGIDRTSLKENPTKEEEEALAQADLWMSIAQSSKQDGKYEAKGASDAADWAISRSLSALRDAERGPGGGVATDADNSPSTSTTGEKSL